MKKVNWIELKWKWNVFAAVHCLPHNIMTVAVSKRKKKKCVYIFIYSTRTIECWKMHGLTVHLDRLFQQCYVRTLLWLRLRARLYWRNVIVPSFKMHFEYVNIKVHVIVYLQQLLLMSMSMHTYIGQCITLARSIDRSLTRLDASSYKCTAQIWSKHAVYMYFNIENMLRIVMDSLEWFGARLVSVMYWIHQAHELFFLFFDRLAGRTFVCYTYTQTLSIF